MSSEGEMDEDSVGRGSGFARGYEEEEEEEEEQRGDEDDNDDVLITLHWLMW